MLVNAVD